MQLHWKFMSLCLLLYRSWYTIFSMISILPPLNQATDIILFKNWFKQILPLPIFFQLAQFQFLYLNEHIHNSLNTLDYFTSTFLWLHSSCYLQSFDLLTLPKPTLDWVKCPSATLPSDHTHCLFFLSWYLCNN